MGTQACVIYTTGQVTKQLGQYPSNYIIYYFHNRAQVMMTYNIQKLDNFCATTW